MKFINKKNKCTCEQPTIDKQNITSRDLVIAMQRLVFSAQKYAFTTKKLVMGIKKIKEK